MARFGDQRLTWPTVGVAALIEIAGWPGGMCCRCEWAWLRGISLWQYLSGT